MGEVTMQEISESLNKTKRSFLLTS